MIRPSPSVCPKCNAPSPCVNWEEVDIGVGTQTFGEQYCCPTHGEFAFVVDTTTWRSRAVFQDDELAASVPVAPFLPEK